MLVKARLFLFTLLFTGQAAKPMLSWMGCRFG